MPVTNYLILDEEPAENEKRRNGKYDREPVTLIFFSDEKSRSFWVELPDEVTKHVVGFYDMFRSKSGPMPEDWLQDSLSMAFGEANDWDATYPDEDPNISASEVLEKLVSALRREFGGLDEQDSSYSFAPALMRAFRTARYYKETADAAS